MIKAKSFVLSAAFPGSKQGIDGIRRALDLLAPWGIDTIEYYSTDVSPDRIAALMQGKRSIFLAGARQKAENLNPCSLDRDIREKAVSGLEECFHYARQAGAVAVMLSSGARPANEKDDAECLALLTDSVNRLHEFESDLPILLEPGDRDVEYRHLLGPTAWAAEFAFACRNQGIPLGLIFDMSHAAQLGENLEEAWNKARPVCDHVHFANCVLRKDSPIYGDKHPFFEVPYGVYTHKDAQNFYILLQNEQIPLTASLEIICPAGEDEYLFFNRITASHPWFFTAD
jgi:sugar phosphate isomerase/epimerase